MVHFVGHFPHTQSRAQGSSRPYPLFRRPGPTTGARDEGCGDAASGWAAGSPRGRREPPPLLSQAAASVGRRSWRRSLGRGKRAAASPPPPRLRNAPPAATPADRLTLERSRTLPGPLLPRTPPRASPNPLVRNGSTPAAGSERCRGGRGGPGSQGVLLASKKVSRGCNHGVSPSPRRGWRSYSLHSGYTSGVRTGSAQFLSINPPRIPGAQRISDPAIPSASLARRPSSPAPSLGTRSPGRQAPRFP